MGKPDGLSKRFGEEKSAMGAKFVEEEQLLDLVEDENDNKGNAEDIELEEIDISKWDKHNGLWFVSEEHNLEVLQQHNDSQVAGHWGRHGTQELVSRNFTLERWSQDVANYVAGCIQCQKSKPDRHSKQTKLVLMLTGERPVEEIAMDSVGTFPESEGFYAILIVTDRFTKVQLYLTAKTT